MAQADYETKFGGLWLPIVNGMGNQRLKQIGAVRLDLARDAALALANAAPHRG